MNPERTPRVRLQTIATVSALLLLATFMWVSSTQAAEPVFGGLGRVDESTISSGTEGNHGQVNPGGKNHSHAFAVDPKTGNFFIADEFTSGTGNKQEHFARVQEFSSGAEGTFLAESRVKLHTTEGFPFERVGGLAVDSEKGKLYLLVDEERESDTEVEEQIEEINEPEEGKLAKKEKALEKAKQKSEPTAQLEKEVQELKDELKALEAELPLYDSEVEAAAELISFDVTPTGSKELTQHKLLVREDLLPNAREGKTPLLDPTGIAVDPTTHDIVIAGQQDEAPDTPKGKEEVEEYWHAAAQIVHENGELGPRYVDGLDSPTDSSGLATINCLDAGRESAGEEPACIEDAEDEPSSPVVSSGGRLFFSDIGEIWEIPSSTDRQEEFQTVATVKDLDTKPRHLFTLEEDFFGQVIHEEEGGAMSLVTVASQKPGWREGRFYLDAKITGNGSGSGVVEVAYDEPEVEEKGKEREAREIGWTAGQNSNQSNCELPSGVTTPVLVAGLDGEHVFAFTTSPMALSVWEYGPGNGAEACGTKPTVVTPTAQVGNNHNASEAGVGEAVKFSSQMTGAIATEVIWTLKHVNPETGKAEEEKIEPGYDPQISPTLEHQFSGAGEYEISETIKTDSLAYPQITSATAKFKVTSISARLAPLESVKAQEEVGIRVKLEDPAETPAHLKVLVNFGDGTPSVSSEYEGSPKEVEIKHVFAVPGDYEVTLEATDKSGVRHASAKILAEVGKSAAELQKEAEEVAAREAAAKRAAEEAAAKKAAEEATAKKAAEEAAAREAAAKKAAEEAAAKKAAEEAAAKKKHEEELAKSKKPLTRAQLLAKALKQCKKGPKKKRSKCEATARKKYGPKKKKKK